MTPDGALRGGLAVLRVAGWQGCAAATPKTPTYMHDLYIFRFRAVRALAQFKKSMLSLMLFAAVSSAWADYYVGPTALGNASGSDWNNRAAYTTASFWNTMQTALNTGPVVVRFAGGTYSQGMLDLSNKGHPVNLLTIMANTLHAPVFSSSVSHQLKLRGAQNIRVYGLKFSGTGITSFAVWCQSSGKNTSRFLTFDTCKFENLTQVAYGAIGILDNSRDITVTGCTFANVGIGGGAHMLYCDHDARNITVTNCSFTNCKGDYVRFRDDTDFAKVDNCTFHSTSTTYNQDFIRMPLFNDVNPGDEYFGTDFQFTNNDFTYDVASGTNRVAIAFDVSGYNSTSYDFSPTTTQAATLSGTDYTAARALLSSNMGIEGLRVKIHGNSFSGTAYWEAYGYFANYGSTGSGVNGYTNVRPGTWASSGTLGAAPKLSFNANFERAGRWLRNWDSMWNGTAPVSHAGLNGTSKAARMAATGVNEMWQWVASPLTTSYTHDLLFAVGPHSGTGAKFRVDIFHNTVTDSRVSVGVSDSGQFGIFNGSSFVALPELGTLQFSLDANSDGDYSDAGDTLRWYKLRIVGNYSGATPYVDIHTSNVNSTTLSNSSLGKSIWVNGGPATGQKAGCVNYRNDAAAVILDELTWQ